VQRVSPFVAGFAKIAQLLNQLLRRGESSQLGQLTPEQLDAFEKLRQRLLDSPILSLPRSEWNFILDTDASNHQIGCTLLQDQPYASKHPIGYWSLGLRSAENDYCTTEQKCLAIVRAVLQLRPYLEGKRFVIRADHHALKWVPSLAYSQGRLARWRLRLLEFDFEVQYSPGKALFAADTLSSLEPADPELFCPSSSVDAEIPCFSFSSPSSGTNGEHNTFAASSLQSRDPALLQVVHLLEDQAADPLCRHLFT
jgi:hypothetical protein